jgi:acyl carrier protein
MNAHDLQRLTGIFRTLFNDDNLVLRDDLTAPDVPGWDSMNHVTLVVLIEEEFQVRFTTDEVTSFQNVGDLIRVLGEKLVVRKAA